jgi:hypothetical protein
MMDIKEHPILFTGDMVCAILNGSKTQTRRVIKGNAKQDWLTSGILNQVKRFAPSVNGWWTMAAGESTRIIHCGHEMDGGHIGSVHCPYGVTGDHLWVRETWAAIWPAEDEVPLEECNIEYRADTDAPYPGRWPTEEARGNPDAPKWRPSILMPRWASRITLEVTEVRVQRLQEITPEDIEAEGVPRDRIPEEMYLTEYRVHDFIHLWNSSYAKRGYGWDANPWVWVISFRRIRS